MPHRSHQMGEPVEDLEQDEPMGTLLPIWDYREHP